MDGADAAQQGPNDKDPASDSPPIKSPSAKRTRQCKYPDLHDAVEPVGPEHLQEGVVNCEVLLPACTLLLEVLTKADAIAWGDGVFWEELTSSRALKVSTTVHGKANGQFKCAVALNCSLVAMCIAFIFKLHLK